MISSVPAPISPNSNAIMPGTEKREWAPCTPGSVKPSSTSPAAVSPRPIHCLRPTRTPSTRSAMIASNTTPPASTACTTDSGTIDIAATWKIQAPLAITIPTANQREEYSWRAVRNGRRMSTAGAARAPRCLYRKPMLVASAQASASKMPRRVVIGD
jgi:hypothetical protein